jgi:hypothetical protein
MLKLSALIIQYAKQSVNITGGLHMLIHRPVQMNLEG